MSEECIVRPQITVLSEEQVAQVHERTLHILSSVGVRVDSERARLAKRLQAVSSDLAQARDKLANSSFLERAPVAVVDKEKAKAADLSALVEKLEAQLAELGS